MEWDKEALWGEQGRGGSDGRMAEEGSLYREHKVISDDGHLIWAAGRAHVTAACRMLPQLTAIHQPTNKQAQKRS